jgi:hypothetical protein
LEILPGLPQARERAGGVKIDGERLVKTIASTILGKEPDDSPIPGAGVSI